MQRIHEHMDWRYGRTKPPYSVSIQTKEDIKEIYWSRSSLHILYTMKDDNGIEYIHFIHRIDGNHRCHIRKHNNDKLIKSMVSIVGSIFNDVDQRSKVLALLQGWPEMHNVFRELHTELKPSSFTIRS